MRNTQFLHFQAILQWFKKPRVLRFLCLWAMIAGAGVYLAHAFAEGF
jgi:hypothetical protein